MKTIIKYITAIICVSIVSSCGDEFLTLTPKDQLTDLNFFQTESDAQQALTGVYGQLQPNQTYGVSIDAADIEWAMSGDLYEMDGSAARIEIHTLALPASNTKIRDMYQQTYTGVSRANFTISRVSQMEELDADVKEKILAQAKFLRAIYYYRLVNYFGGVPLVLEELDASSEMEIPRATAEEVWAQIETDLTEAIAVLPETWEGDDFGRATKGAAQGFLAKAYLWQEKWADVVRVSEEIINSGHYGLVENFRDIFKEENEANEEIVFATQFRGGNDGEGSNIVYRTAPRGAPSEFTGSGAWSNFVPQGHWVNAFEKDGSGKIKDERYWDVIIGPGEPHQDMPDFVMPTSVPDGWSKTGYITTKYWQKATIGMSGVNAPVLRYAEILLNYAEALNEVGRSAEAMAQVNLIRQRAELDAKSTALGKDAVLDAIFYERRMEFIWESAGAFSDLNRRGRFIDFIRENRPNFAQLNVDSKPWLQTQPILLPIPREAWERNKALEQNPGYTF
ncbi:RagB/SusD family nutrient uptake outer membrane protein [Albibacterium indicum]|uniref:RagB/SusD family nutrient uptake outer membrane protein n=1 Tax=Albibacterium indicum TaxID=2292082 RepID=UPI000E4F0954|nr:RagB/SusD family nutrient uptake outer membrane protein [Pedobacter indicus]